MVDEDEGKEVVFKINENVLDSAEFSARAFQEDLQFLTQTMGDSLLNITSESLSNLNQLRLLHYLAESFQFFQENESLDRLIKRFKSPQEARAHISTVYFTRYVLGELGEIEFEPDQSDVEVQLEDGRVIFEFKRPQESEEVQEYRKQHKEILNTIKEILDKRYQYDIRYKVPDDIQFLPPLLESYITEISGPGETMLTGTIEVTARKSGGYNEEAPIQGFVLDIAMHDLDSGRWMPLTQYSGKEATFSIAGPEIDETDKLERLIDRARKQIESGKPSVIAINVGHMMGSISDLQKQVKGLFQISKNTRINAVILYDYAFRSVEGGIQFTSRKIRNPYAKERLPEGFFGRIPDLDDELVTD